MIEGRIGEVRLRVRTDVSDAAMLRPAAERLVRAALERCAALLEERAPGRVVLIRRLPLRCRVDESTIDEAAHVEALARSAADAIERVAVPAWHASVSAVADSSRSADVAVLFDDEAHLRASHLLAVARGQSAWLDNALDTADARDPLAALAAPDRRAVADATLARLARDGVLAEVLAAHPAPAVAVLAAALGCSGRPAAPGEHESPQPSAVATLAAAAAAWPPLDAAAKALALRVHASLLAGAPLDAPATAALAGEAAVTNAFRGAGATTEQSATAVPPPAEVDGSAVDESAVTLTTRCAGLFYLIDRVQELDLGEALWKACLPEGAVLAAAAAALLGDGFRGEPAPRLLGGVRRVRCPKVTADQHREVAAATCAALAAALPRRGLAEVPDVTLCLVEHVTGRLLIAAPNGSPFTPFAWPAQTPQAVRDGLRTFLDAWPQRAGIDGPPALAALDVTGRVRATSDVATPRLPFQEAASTEAAALLAIVAGAPAFLFAARAAVGAHVSVADFVRTYIARPGRVRLTGQRLDVMLDASDVDVDLRRAALDRDPGWVPWLRRTVRFVFEEREPAQGEDE